MVAANRRTSMNSHASLDLAQIANFFAPPLRSTVSTPLLEGTNILGVLTAYSLTEEAFTESHRYTFEQVASALSTRITSLRVHWASNLVSFPTKSI
jgi:LytS/YehU family sensor histidine kinase